MERVILSVNVKYRYLSMSRRSIICLSPRPLQVIDPLFAEKSRYFAQTRSMIVYYRDLIKRIFEIHGNVSFVNSR